jgi:hypothetical protein
MILDVRKRVDKIEDRLASLDRIESKLDDLGYLVNNIMGFSGTNHLMMERLGEQVKDLSARVTRLEERL